MAEAIEAGADDFLAKPFDSSELRVRLRAGKRIAELQQTLRFRATHDSLTGVWNHGSITNSLDQEIVRAARESTLVGVLLADLDHFKQVNDTYGHLVGDQVLQQTAERMHSVGPTLRCRRALWGRGIPDCSADAQELGVRSFDRSGADSAWCLQPRCGDLCW